MKNCFSGLWLGVAVHACVPSVRLRRLLLLPWVLGLGGLAFGQSLPATNGLPSVPIDPVVITATRTPTPLSEVLADISVIDRATIERSGATGLAEVLAQLPGVEMARTGGMGGVSTVYLRGAESRFTAVLVDGVRVDSQSTGGAEWEQIPLGLIDHIEVLRGPAAAIYGSDAVAGVVQVFTRQAMQGTHEYASLAAGSYGTQTGRAGVTSRQPAWDYALGLQYEHSRSFVSLDQNGLDPSKFGYQNAAINAKVGYALSPDQRIQASLLSSDQTKGFVNLYDGPNYDTVGYARTQELLRTLGVQWLAQWSPAYSTQLSASQSLDHNASRPVSLAVPNDEFLAETLVRNLLWQSDFKLGMNRWTLALERREDSLVNNDYQGDPGLTLGRSQTGLALGYGWQSQRHSLQVNLRHDHYSAFGGHDTGSLAYGYSLAPAWRVTVSAAQGYRAPTLFQQFSGYGTPNLQPETSRNAEMALHYSQDGSNWSLTAYHNRVNQLIGFSTDWSCVSHCYLNTGRANMPGVTLAGQTTWWGWSLAGSADWQNPTDLDTHQSLVRRAHRHTSLSASHSLAAWTLGLQAQATSSRRDSYPQNIQLPGFAVLNLNASTAITRDWSVRLRLDNLADKRYQWVEGYATPGRSVYASVKWAPTDAAH